VGPAGLASSKQIKGLNESGTFGDSDVFQYLSHSNVSAGGAVGFESLYHSVYEGRERLGHYVRISPARYAAYDASGRYLGKFGSTRRAFAAVGVSAREGVR
jgi:hypothetical protein